MKDLVLKKKTELEEHRRRAHLIGDVGCETEFPIEDIEAGKIYLYVACLPHLVNVCHYIWQLFCIHFMFNWKYVQLILESI
jgi:hypothetical protein